MTTKDAQRLQAMLAPSFTEFAGKVFAHVAFQGFRVRAAPRKPTTVDENTDNHVHFDFFSGNTKVGVHDNFRLAEAARLIWQVQLRQRFPRKRFRLFVSNEYQIWPTTRKPVRVKAEAIETVLRLWSLPADDATLDEVYRPDETGADRVLWPEFRRAGLVRLPTVLAIMQQSASHPAKARTLRKRWHAI